MTRQDPVIVKIIEPEATTLGDVLLGALGLTGVLVLGAAAAGVLMAAVLYWLRSRNA